jgi:hypothetical protein
MSIISITSKMKARTLWWHTNDARTELTRSEAMTRESRCGCGCGFSVNLRRRYRAYNGTRRTPIRLGFIVR